MESTFNIKISFLKGIGNDPYFLINNQKYKCNGKTI